ncbi:MAG TPA: MMPL family transporter [Jatrophihabitans sp.]|nr:MMPL family transporter [Jatrophihabitans sp.]
MTKLDEALAPPPAAPPRRPRTVWVLAALAAVFFLVGLAGGAYQGKLSDVQKNDNSAFLPSSADSTKVSDAAQNFNRLQTIPGFVVYQRAGGLTGQDLRKIYADAKKFPGVRGVAGAQVGAPKISQDHTVAATSVPLIGKNGNKSVNGPALVDTEKAVLKIARTGVPPGLVVHSAGAGGVLVAFIDAFNGLDGTLLIAAGLVVVVILLFVYRSPVLWFFPLFSAGLALGAAALVIYPLAKHGVITLNGQSQGILSVLVIGAGTDYALLLVSRYREELHEHRSRIDAMVAAWKGAAPPIAASACTVILGLLCLTVAELKSTATLGPVCAIGIACTVLVMLTVLPTLLVLCGRWIFWPKRPQVDHQSDIDTTHRTWSRFANTLARNHRAAWVSAAVALIACAIAIIGLKTQGLSTTDAFTNNPDAVVGQHLYDKAFPQSKGAGAPADILVNADKAPAVIAAVKNVEGVSQEPNGVCVEIDYSKLTPAYIQANPQVVQQLARTCPPPALQVTPHNGKLLVGATLTSSYDSTAAYDTINRLRSTVSSIPGADALVGGSSATNLDIQNASRHDRNLIIPLVLAVILLVLAVVLRALVAPLILIATVVLSFTASLGVSALFFNHVFHFTNADPAFPLFAFVFLVALGIDYNIFLMTRVREETIEHGTRRGIVRGLAVTGGVITSAGIVLAATFVVLGVLPIVFLAEVGFTVAFGVLLDTIVVRSILVPALSYDIGKKIWWPSRLAAARAPD